MHEALQDPVRLSDLPGLVVMTLLVCSCTARFRSTFAEALLALSQRFGLSLCRGAAGMTSSTTISQMPLPSEGQARSMRSS